MVNVAKTDIAKLEQSERLTPGITFDDLNNGDIVKCIIWTSNLQPVTKNREITVEKL